jgi:hypothetical protein
MDNQMIEELILDGTLEIAGLTDSGEFTYSFTDKVQEQHPEIYESLQKMLYQNIAKFWELGFIDFDVTVSDPIVKLTEKAFDEQAITDLDEMDRLKLYVLIKAITKSQE